MLLAVKPVAPKLSIVGSLLAIVLFVGTTSFLFTTPGLGEPAGGGFPAITLLGEFLTKTSPCWACHSGHSPMRSGHAAALQRGVTQSTSRRVVHILHRGGPANGRECTADENVLVPGPPLRIADRYVAGRKHG